MTDATPNAAPAPSSPATTFLQLPQCKGYQRRLHIHWGEKMVSVFVYPRAKHGALCICSAHEEPSAVLLVKATSYILYVGKVRFWLGEDEGEMVLQKFRPLGLRFADGLHDAGVTP